MTLWLAILLQAGSPAAQDAWQEIRFHRVHLRNGNFIDGQLVRETPSTVHLQLKSGQMAVRRDLIERVEYVKMRHISEKSPAVVAPPVPADPAALRAGPAPLPAAPKRSRGSAASAKVSPELKAKVEAVLQRLLRGTAEQKAEAGAELKALGTEAAVYAADVLDVLDDGAVQIVAPILVDLKSPDVISIIQGKVGNARPIVRAECAAILGASAESAEDVRVLLPLAKDVPAVALPAINAMAKHGLPEAFPVALQLSRSKDESLRRAALAAVVQIGRKAEREADLEPAFKDLLEASAGPALVDVLTQVASSKLAGLAGPTAELLAADDAAVRAKAAQVLGDLGDKSSGDAVVNRLDDETDKWAKVHLAQAALKLRLQKSIDPLIEWMDDEDGDIRVAALETLKKLTGENAGLSKEAWLEWRKKKSGDR